MGIRESCTRTFSLIPPCVSIGSWSPVYTIRGFDIVMYSSDTSSFTMSGWLVPALWSLVLISLAVTSAVYVWTLRLTHALSCAWTTSKLCRWLAGCSQRITAPYFIRSTSFNPYFFFSHYLLILYHTLSALSSLYYIAFWFGGRERNRTPPNWWIPLSILSNDIQTHGASTISDPVMPVRNERFASPFSFSTYIIPLLAANVKSLLIFF